MRNVLCILLTLGFASGGFAQSPPRGGNAAAPLHPPFNAEDAQTVIPALESALEENYVFPHVGNRYAAMLRANLAAGRYSAFADSGAFAETVTADLQAIAPDRHLALVAPRTDAPPSAVGSSTPPRRPPSIGKSGWIAPRVAYIEFHGFPSDKETLARLETFIRAHARARTLIIDTTNENYGGWIAEADLLFGHLFSKPTDLVAIDMRKSVHDRMGGLSAPSIREVDSPFGVVRYIHSVKPSANL